MLYCIFIFLTNDCKHIPNGKDYKCKRFKSCKPKIKTAKVAKTAPIEKHNENEQQRNKYHGMHI
jgi:hypothetical protein